MTKRSQNCEVKVDQNNQQMHRILQGDQDILMMMLVNKQTISADQLHWTNQTDLQ